MPDSDTPADKNDEFWAQLRWLLRPPAGTGPAEWIQREWSADQKIEILSRIVMNLVDEVEILKTRIEPDPGQTPEQTKERYCAHRMWLLFSSAGATSPPLAKYADYLLSPNQVAEKIVPDPVAREKAISDLSMLT